MDTAHDIDLRKEVQDIRVAAGGSLVLTAGSFAAGYVVLPRFFRFPADTLDALVFTLRVDLFILLWVVVAIGLVSMPDASPRRTSAAAPSDSPARPSGSRSHSCRTP